LQKKTQKKNVAKQTFTKPFATKESFTRAYWTTLPLTTTHTKFAKTQRWSHIEICSKNL
jgi:phosphopantetheinyl transferase (holo-ACP synthase)